MWIPTVTYPGQSQASTYTYAADHYYTGGTDARGNPLPSSTYFGQTDTDPNGLPLNGRLQSVSDALSETTSYAYNLATNTTTITYPADASGAVGSATMVYDSNGDLLTSTDPLGHTTKNVYDANHNLTSVTDPLGNITTYKYDSNGNRSSTTYPKTATSTNTTSSTAYNQYSEPISTTDEDGNVRTFNYDANYNPLNVSDSAGTLAQLYFQSKRHLAGRSHRLRHHGQSVHGKPVQLRRQRGSHQQDRCAEPHDLLQLQHPGPEGVDDDSGPAGRQRCSRGHELPI